MPPEQGAPSMLQLFFPLLIVYFIFWLLVFKPQKDKQKEHKARLANLKKNDNIVTAAGIHGTVINIKDATVVIRIDDNAKMEIDKEAVASIVTAAK